MCFPSCLCCFEFLPFVCLVTIPFYGAFCGVDVIIRLSLLLVIQSILINFIPKQWTTIIPYSQAVLLVILAYLPVNLTPWPVIWLYRIILLVSEPVLQLLEVVLVQNYVMKTAQWISDEYDTDEPRTKAVIILFSSVCYGITSTLAWSVYTEGTTIQIWCLLLVFISFVMIHNMMVISPEGIISDAAFCGLCSMAVLYAMVQETSIIQHPTKPPQSWDKYTNSSLVNLLLKILSFKTEYALQAVELLKMFLKPFFLVTLVIRLYSILFVVDKININILHSSDSIEEEEFEITTEEELIYKLSPWRSPLIIKIAIIFMFTQLSVAFLCEISGQHVLNTRWPLLSVYSIWPTQLLIGRIIQILTVTGFYIWRLYCAEDWEWSEWL